MSGTLLLKRWWEIKQQLSELQKEEEAIRSKIKTVMITKRVSQIRGGDYRVLYREMSRENLSKKDCPSEVWNKYCKKITYPMLKIEYLGQESIEEEQE